VNDHIRWLDVQRAGDGLAEDADVKIQVILGPVVLEFREFPGMIALGVGDAFLDARADFGLGEAVGDG
jgi:hypothetical protein